MAAAFKEVADQLVLDQGGGLGGVRGDGDVKVACPGILLAGPDAAG
jgi:hypothetical protein